MRTICLFICCLVLCTAAQSQETAVPSPLAIVDDIQFDLKDIYLSPKGDTATVELFMISIQKNPREFKLNTFASGVTSSDGTLYFYDSMEMGKVRLHIADRQNYLNYLMQQDLPVLLRIKTAGWSKNWGKPQHIKLTFEDSSEEGKFLQVDLNF